eukprot:2845859-Pyramimonas_sp.AAC.1
MRRERALVRSFGAAPDEQMGHLTRLQATRGGGLCLIRLARIITDLTTRRSSRKRRSSPTGGEKNGGGKKKEEKAAASYSKREHRTD